MPDSISFDFSELTKLAADLGEVPKTAGPFINSAIQKTSGFVKEAAQKSVSKGGKRWSRAVGAIDYELKVEAGLGGSSITSEIGYDKDKVLPQKPIPAGSKRKPGPGTAGNIGSLREFGKPGLTPHNDLLNALHENEKDFEFGLSEALKDAEKAAGL